MSDEGLAPRLEPRTLFLEGLAAGMSITAAAARVGVHRDTAYGWRERDPEFATAWDRARDAGTDLLEDEAWRRAIDGTERAVYQNGELVGAVRQYSDRLLEVLLKGRRPEMYRDSNSKLEVSGTISLTAMVEQAAQRRIERAKVLELQAEPE